MDPLFRHTQLGQLLREERSQIDAIAIQPRATPV